MAHRTGPTTTLRVIYLAQRRSGLPPSPPFPLFPFQHLCLVLGQGRKRGRRQRERWGGKCVKTILCKCFSCSCFKCVLPLRSRPKWQRPQQAQQQQQQEKEKKIRSTRRWRQRIAQVFGAAFIVPVHLEFYLKWIMPPARGERDKNPRKQNTRTLTTSSLFNTLAKKKMNERKRKTIKPLNKGKYVVRKMVGK